MKEAQLLAGIEPMTSLLRGMCSTTVLQPLPRSESTVVLLAHADFLGFQLEAENQALRREVNGKRKLSSTENVVGKSDADDADNVARRDSSVVDDEISRAVEGRVQVIGHLQMKALSSFILELSSQRTL